MEPKDSYQLIHKQNFKLLYNFRIVKVALLKYVPIVWKAFLVFFKLDAVTVVLLYTVQVRFALIKKVVTVIEF